MFEALFASFLLLKIETQTQKTFDTKVRGHEEMSPLIFCAEFTLPRNGLVIDMGSCGEFTEDGRDNGLIPANVIEDQFDWHNDFVGQ